MPEAKMEKRRGWSVLWLIPIAAAGIAGWLSYREFASKGMEIQIWFQDAYGLQAGNSPIKFRGVDVGMVKELGISEDRLHTIVTATLHGEYEDLARDGSDFWVVRPQISGQGISGLTTIMSQNYVQMRKGGGGEPRKKFMGLDQAPVTRPTSEQPRGLPVSLLAPRRWGLSEGAGVYYRGIRVGSVLTYQLDTNASSVRFDALIHDPFTPLVRVDSRFWKSGGLDVSAGLFSGLDVKVNDLRSLIDGGIEFATPTEPGQQAATNSMFRIHEEPEREWIEWRPVIHIKGGGTISAADRERRNKGAMERELSL